MEELDDKVQKGKIASVTGFASEQRLLATLLVRGYNASRVEFPYSTYGIIAELREGDWIRIQVKTAVRSILFTGVGKYRMYGSELKPYRQTTETSDIIVGVRCEGNGKDTGDTIDFFFLPTIYTQELDQGSITVTKIRHTMNDWEILKNCKDVAYVTKRFSL